MKKFVLKQKHYVMYMSLFTSIQKNFKLYRHTVADVSDDDDVLFTSPTTYRTTGSKY